MSGGQRIPGAAIRPIVRWTRHAVLVMAGALAACGNPGTIVRDRPVEVRVPVPQPCASERPAKVVPLKEKIPREQWDERDVRQKAAAVAAQALEHQTYGEQLDAATAACPEAR